MILASLAVVSWSTVATAFKVALQTMGAYEMLFVACATALIIYTIWMLATGSWHELRLLSPALWSRFAILGLIAPVVYYLMLFKAYDLLPAQIAQPINYVWPILLAILIAVIEKKSIPKRKYFGMVVSLGGVVVISMGGSAISGEISVTGIILAVTSAMLWGIYWLINDSLKSKVSQIPALFLTFLFGMAYLFIGNFFMPVSHLEPESLLAGMYIGAFEMGLPFICFGIAIRETNNPALINQLCYLAPFLSLFFIDMVLEEPIVFTTYVGLAFIIGGIIFNQMKMPKSVTFKPRLRPRDTKSVDVGVQGKGGSGFGISTFFRYRDH